MTEYEKTVRLLRLLQLSGGISYFSKRLKKTFDLIINDEKAFPKVTRNWLLIRIGRSEQTDENVVEAFSKFRTEKGKLSISTLRKLKDLYSLYTKDIDMCYNKCKKIR